MDPSTKIVVIGPESTGKSILSQDLALHFQAPLVCEYARRYLGCLGRPYVQEDLSQIAIGQIQAEDQALEDQPRLLFCDTDLQVIRVWSEHRYGSCDTWILSQIARRTCDLYLLTDIDLPWQDDPLREHPAAVMREYFYRIYREIILDSGVAWAPVRGTGGGQRLSLALKAIGSLPKFSTHEG